MVMERINARYLTMDALPERCDLVTVDVSFISLTKVVPALLQHLKMGALLLPMIKPQFEAGRRQVGKGGIVRDPEIRRRVIDQRVADLGLLSAGGVDLATLGVRDSAVAGMNGNREAFALFQAVENRRLDHGGDESSIGETGEGEREH